MRSARSLTPHPRNGNPLFELYRIVASAREERQRRIDWEREQEAKAAQRQIALEQQVLDMRQELNMLRTYIGMHPNNPTPPAMQPQTSINTIPTTAHIEPVSPTAELSPQTPLSPASPVSHHPEVHLPMFVEGSSSRPLAARNPYATNASYSTHSPAFSVLSPPPSATPSPQFASAQTTPSTLQTEPSELLAPPTPQSIGPSVTPTPASPKPRANPRKRPRSDAEDESDRNHSSGSEDESDDSSSDRVRASWNVSGRCSTIHVGAALHQ
ncbi:hypothetical protein TRAPUB_10370 [Trametes pubescens]|uniref:Uncharacterized protein n=1 Tax=Trametes pubescens TaxID=154538 RepID=A0A1M2VZZ3_TRAPU|nr:hypothetical protein TRAPUB_10370 [Trametes pubescens]